jgi:pimeloyl-ACP methyl ester carboxylesterase
MEHELTFVSDTEEFRAYAAAKRHFFDFYRRRPVQLKDEEKAFMETGEPIEVLHAGERLEVRAWGEGPAVLLLHGILASGGVFRQMVPQLAAAGFRAVAFDAPAHGGSPGAYAYMDEVADAILDVRGACGPIAGALGHSLGAGWLLGAQRVGLAAPRLVCMNALTAFGASFDFYVARTQMHQQPKVLAHFTRLMDAFSPKQPYAPLNIVASLDVPGLIVHDRDDPLARFEGGEELARAWRGSKTYFSSKLGHNDTLYDTGVIEAVVSFFKDGGGRTR